MRLVGGESPLVYRTGNRGRRLGTLISPSSNDNKCRD